MKSYSLAAAAFHIYSPAISPSRPEYYYARWKCMHTHRHIYIYVAAASASNRLKDSCRQLHSARPFLRLGDYISTLVGVFSFRITPTQMAGYR
jgi:hypothetical protein